MALLHLSSGWQGWAHLKLVLMRFLLPPQAGNSPVRHWHWIYRGGAHSASTQQDKWNFPSCWWGAHGSYILMEWCFPWHKSQVVATDSAPRHIPSPHDSVQQHFSGGTGTSDELKCRFYVFPLGNTSQIKPSAGILKGWYLFHLQNHLAASRRQGVPKLDPKLSDICSCV